MLKHAKSRIYMGSHATGVTPYFILSFAGMKNFKGNPLSSTLTMKQSLRHWINSQYICLPQCSFSITLLALACHLDFTFTSIWLSSSENALADAASRFLYARLFQLAPYLNKQPSLKLLWIGGISDMHSSPKLLHSTSGMGSHPAHGHLPHWSKVLHQIYPAPFSRKRRWFHTPCIPASHYAMGCIPWHRIQPKTIKAYLTNVWSMHTDLSLPFTATDSPLIQCLIRRIKKFHGECDHKPRQPITLSVLTDILSHLNTEKAGYSTIYAAVASPMLASSAAENSHWNLPSLTSHLKPSSLQPQSSSSHHMKMQNLSQFSSQLLKQTRSAKVLPFNLPPLQARQLVQLQHSSSFSKVFTLQTRRNHSSQPQTTLPSHSPKVSSFLHLQSP